MQYTELFLFKMSKYSRNPYCQKVELTHTVYHSKLPPSELFSVNLINFFQCALMLL